MKYTFSHEFLVRKEKKRNIIFEKIRNFYCGNFTTSWSGQASCRTLSACPKHRKARRSLLISIFFSIQLQQLYTQLLSTNGSAPTIELHNASITNRKGDNLHVQAVGQQWQAVSLPKGETQDWWMRTYQSRVSPPYFASLPCSYRALARVFQRVYPPHEYIDWLVSPCPTVSLRSVDYFFYILIISLWNTQISICK